jgi:hypothetical protein
MILEDCIVSRTLLAVGGYCHPHGWLWRTNEHDASAITGFLVVVYKTFIPEVEINKEKGTVYYSISMALQLCNMALGVVLSSIAHRKQGSIATKQPCQPQHHPGARSASSKRSSSYTKRLAAAFLLASYYCFSLLPSKMALHQAAKKRRKYYIW